VVELVEGSAQPPEVWQACFRQVLVPSFPAGELVEEEDFLSARDRDSSWVLMALDGGRPVGVSMVDAPGPGDRLGLLSYLAAHPTGRARGIGSRLMEQVRRRRSMLLVEIEDPRQHADTGFGQPWRRVEFYRRHGVRALQVPFFQPPVAPGVPRVEGMLLGVVMPGPVPDHLASAPIRTYLTAYLRSSGEDVGVPPASTLLGSLDGDQVAVVDLPRAR